MAFLPVFSISRSQRVRLGRGPGETTVPEIGMGDQAVSVMSGGLNVLFYANLADGNVRRDLQMHSAIGAIEAAGAISTGGNSASHPNSDIVVPTAPTVAAGTGLTVNVPAFSIQSRTFGGALTTTAVTNLPLAANTSGSPRVDAVCVDRTGRIFVVTGVASATGAFEVDTVATSGVPTGGTFSLSYVYNGRTYTTALIAYNAAASAVATAYQNAADLPGTVTGTGGALPTSVTLTASGAAHWGLSGLALAANNLTGGTTPSVAFAQSTAGVPGPQAPTVGGVSQTIATVAVANAASSPGSITNSIAPTS